MSRLVDEKRPPDAVRLLGRMRAFRLAGTCATLLAGSSRAALATVVIASAAVWLDWLLRMPGPVRLVLGVAAVAAAGLAWYRNVIRPMRWPDLAAVARQIESVVGAPPDCLPSAAELAARNASGPLAQQTVRSAAQVLERIPAARLVRWRWTIGWFCGCLLVFAALAGSWNLAGWWFERGLSRLAWPIVQVAWPKRVHLTSPHAGKVLTVPLGETAVLRARVVRGPEGTNAWLVLGRFGRTVKKVAMRDDGGGWRSATVRAVESASFWFEAGDDSTRDRPGYLRVVPRPQVISAELRIAPPVYTGAAPVSASLTGGSVRVPEGSRVALTVTVSKPLAERSGGPDAVVAVTPADDSDANDAASPPVRWGQDHRRFTATWTCRGDSLVQVRFVDEDGLSNPPMRPWRITVRPDRPPGITVQSPADNLEVTPAAVVRLQATVTDDWGVADVRLAWRIERLGQAVPSGRDPAQQRFFEADVRTEPRLDLRRIACKYDWSLDSLSLQPGDRVRWFIRARDNYSLAGKQHEPVRSAVMTLRIVDAITLLQAILADLAAVRQKIGGMLSDQQQLRDALSAAAKASERSSTDARRLIDKQGRIIWQGRQAANRLAAIAERMETNRIRRGDLNDSIGWAKGRLIDLAAREMADVQQYLRLAAGSVGNDADRPGPAEAAEAAQDACEALQEILRRTASWSTIEATILALQELIAGQESLRERTGRLAAEYLGLSTEQLSDAVRQSLRRSAAEQRSLAERLGKLQSDMNSQAATSAMLSAEWAVRLRAAAGILQGQAAVPAMSAASVQIARNVLVAAQEKQAAALRAMQEALAVLRGAAPADEAAAAVAAKEQSPEALAESLDSFARRQRQLRAETARIEDGRGSDGRLSRAGLLKLLLAAQEQGTLAEEVGKLAPAVPGPALRQVLASVADRMRQIASRMKGGASGRAVQSAQRDVADVLASLADALRRRPIARRPDGEESAAGAGGPSGGPAGVPPDPAEVQALYLLQADLLRTTRELADRMKSAQPEAQGRLAEQLRALGRRQQELKDLAERVLSGKR